MNGELPATLPERLLGEIDSRLARHGRQGSEALRLFHGRGRCFPDLEFLTVDWFEPVALVTLHTNGARLWLDELSDFLRSRLGGRLACVLAQHRHLPGTPTDTLFGEIRAPAFAREKELRYRLRLGSAKNIGYFPDMREGRLLVRSLASGRKVLNLFAYTCSFSVAALAGNANHVVNLDMNRGALALGRENHRENGIDLRCAAFLNHDLFRSFGKLKTLGPFGLVVIDPPTEQGQSFSAQRDWPKIIRRLDDLAGVEADAIACLNAPQLGPDFLRELFAHHLPSWKLMASLDTPEDFPEREAERGLNILHFRRDAWSHRSTAATSRYRV